MTSEHMSNMSKKSRKRTSPYDKQTRKGRVRMLRLLLCDSQKNKGRMGQDKRTFAALAALFIALTIFALPLRGQQSQVGAQAVNVQPLNQVLSPAGASAVSDFETGSTVRYYWIIANSSGQSSAPTSTFDQKGPASLSSAIGSRVSITWQTATGTTYDVLESSTATLPNSLTCGCAVVTGTTNGQVFDTGSYSAYSTLPLKGFNFIFTNPLDGNGNPEVLVTYNNQTAQLCTFSGGVFSCGSGNGTCAISNAILFKGGCNANFTYATSTGLFSATNAGTFTNVQFNAYDLFTLTGGSSCSPNTLLGGSIFNTEAATACVNLPSGSGTVTNGITNGFGSYVINNNSFAQTVFGNAVANAYYGNVLCNVSHTECEGGVFSVAESLGATTDVTLVGVEVNNGFLHSSRAVKSYGFLFSPMGTVQPDFDMEPGFAVKINNSSNVATTGFECEMAAVLVVTNHAPCFSLYPVAPGPGENSQDITFTSTNTTGGAAEVGQLYQFAEGFGSTVPILDHLGGGFFSTNFLGSNAGTFSVLNTALPCSSTWEGAIGSVKDSTVNAAGAIIVGGGSFHVAAYCNGTNWVVSGGTGSTNGGNTISAGTCPTAGTAYATCSVTVPLNFSEPDTNYSATCSVQAGGSTGDPWVKQISKGVSSIVVTISNLSGALATPSTPGETDCTVTGT